MNIRTEADISNLIKTDPWMMDVLRAAEMLNLPDWWIGAGFLRNKVWDAIAGVEPWPSTDVDLVYFDANNVEPETDWAYDEKMKETYPFADWEIRNQARMHYRNNFDPYTSTADGISHWVETATCVAVKLEKGELKYLFCYGMEDLLTLTARPIPLFVRLGKVETFRERVAEKRWQERWPTLTVTER